MSDWAVRNDKKKQWIIVIPFKRFYSVTETARILGVPDTAVYRKIKRGTLRGVQVEGVTMTRHAALVAYITKRKKAKEPIGPDSRIVPIVPTPAKFTHDSSGRMPKPTSELLHLAEKEFDFLRD